MGTNNLHKYPWLNLYEIDKQSRPLREPSLFGRGRPQNASVRKHTSVDLNSSSVATINDLQHVFRGIVGRKMSYGELFELFAHVLTERINFIGREKIKDLELQELIELLIGGE